MKYKPVFRGLISYFPGLLQFLKKKLGNRKYGGTDSARYCYSIWMRHLIYLNENFNKVSFKCVSEIGPGDSLGMGLMALITGAEKYYAFELKKYIAAQKNIQIFDELVKLFKKKEDIPGDDEFPMIQPKLTSYKFPDFIFKNNFDELIEEKRLDRIKKAIEDEQCEEIEIKYIIPWNKKYQSIKCKIDLLFSQAVMEHILDLDNAYKIIYDVLTPGGVISHEIDFSSHETHEKWNGHLNYSDFFWKIIMHGRPYDINRLPYSKHIEYINKHNFVSIKEIITNNDSEFTSIKNKKVRQYFKNSDFNIQNALIQAIKPDKL
jgi:hypothetical protein